MTIVRRFAATALVCLAGLLSATGCARRGLTLLESADSKSKVVVIGDARTIVQGETNGMRLFSVAPTTYLAAMGTGTIAEDVEQQGDALVLGSSFLVRPAGGTKAGALDSSNAKMYSSFLVGVPADAKPVATYRIRGGGSGMPVVQVYRELLSRHGKQLFVVGKGRFRLVSGEALKKAPTAGESLFGPARPQYIQSGIQHVNANAVFAAALLDGPKSLKGSNRRVFTLAPGTEDTTDELSDARYGLAGQLDKIALDKIDSAAPLVQEVGRLLPSSTIIEGEIAVYAIDELEKR